MTRDEIYDHLAKVYLGKREGVSLKKSKPKAINRSLLVINIVIKEATMIPATPFFALGSFTFTPDDFIQASLNRKEYQTAPKRK